MNIVNKILNKINHLTYLITKIDPITKLKIVDYNTIKLGNKLASWTIPVGFINEHSVCYLVGAGEEISFDFTVAKQYNCKVNIIDPTPRAIIHFNTVIQKYLNQPWVNNINFIPVGIWNEDTIVKFYAPENEVYVSHSVVNLQKTSNYFEAEVRKISTIMNQNNDSKIDLLKIDIEGAEYVVIKSLIKEKVFPKILCIEYDEVFSPMDSNYIERIKESLLLLISNGYKIVYLDYPGNYTLIKD